MWGAAQRKAVSLATVWLQEPIAAADYRAETELRAEVVRLEYAVSKLRLEEKRSVDNAARDASRMASLKKTADKLRSELTQQQRLGERRQPARYLAKKGRLEASRGGLCQATRRPRGRSR